MERSRVKEARDRELLAEAIGRRSRDVEDRWLELLREDTGVSHIPPTELKDGVHLYLQRLAEELRGDRRLGPGATRAWDDVAEEHALTRVRLGFDVTQLTRELVLLRDVLIEILSDEGAVPGSEPIRIITRLIDEALAASLRSYVEARDYAARRQQAEHLGFLVHRIRTPLATTALALGALRRDLGAHDHSATLLERAERNLTRVSELIDEVLQMEKLAAGELDNRPVETTIGAIVDDAVSTCRLAASRKGLGFTAAYDPAAPLYADPRLVVTALEHLLENAIKYTDAGTVALTIEEGKGAERGTLEFHVRDNCPGLSPEELDIAFEPFRRGQSDKQGA